MSEKKQPDVRFKGFSQDWEESNLSFLAEFNPKSELPEVFEYVDLESVVGTELLGSRTETKKTAPSRAQRLARCGDVFYQTVRPYQKNNYVFDKRCGEYVFSTGYAQLRPFGNSYYLISFLQNNSFVKKVLDDCTGTSYPAINSNSLANINVVFSNDVEEQTKIGELFKELDNLITLNQSKYDKLLSMKKACLEKMFPKDGADTPELRFKGFSGKWEECKLGNSIVECTERTSDFSNYPLYSLTIEKGVTEKTERYERSFLVTKEVDLFKIVPPQCFVTNPMNLRFGAVGYNKKSYDISVSGYYDVFSIDESRCSEFWTTYLKTSQVLKKYNDVATGSLIEKRRVHFKELKKIELLVPVTIQEKKQIGLFFQNLENLITLRKTELNKLINIKKALLEKMFI